MFERTADLLDLAADIQADLNERAITKAREKSLPETHPDFDGSNCVDCDEPVEGARLSLGKVRCFACQVVLEKKRKLGVQK